MHNTQEENTHGFIELPSSIVTWFLDTCAWSEIISSESKTQNFISLFEKNNYLAGLTTYTLFELSRVDALSSKLDTLFYKMRHSIWLAIPYDKLMNIEQNMYPEKPKMKWLSLSAIVDKNTRVENFLTRLKNSPRFKKIFRRPH